MSYIRKVDLVKTQDQFREYVSSKNPRSGRMLKIFDELMEREKVGFAVDDEMALLYEDKDLPKTEVSGFSPQLLIITASKKPGKWGRVSIDTGYVEITEKGEILTSGRAQAHGWSFDKWYVNALEGLKAVKTEVEKAIKIYEKIFPYGKPKKL